MPYRSQDHSGFQSPNTVTAAGFQRTAPNLRLQRSEVRISKRKFRQAETIQLVREKREQETQTLGFSSRPFVLCGLSVKRPKIGCLLHERRNGQFLLQITGHPTYGLP